MSGLTADTQYSFTVQAKDAAGNVSKATSPVVVLTAPGGDRTLSSDTDYPIRDFTSARSPITSTLTGAATRPVTLAITIQHTCAEDLGISLFDSHGRQYPIKYSGSGNYLCTPWTGAKMFTVSKVSSPAAGTWMLRVTDYGPADTGTLDRWSITL